MERIGIDLGGTKTEIVVIKNKPENILFKKRVPTEQKKGYLHIVNIIKDLYEEATKKLNSRLPLGIGIPGSVSPKTGMIRNANTQVLNGEKLKYDLEKILKVSIEVENDANCLALSEYHFGNAAGYKSVLAIIMGTGMGAGMVIDGQLVAGFSGVAAEIGHLSLDIGGKKCWCKNRGCLERYLSGSALEELYFEESGLPKKVQEIYALYKKNDTTAISTIQKFMDFFGRAMSNLADALDPEVIVIGGGLSNLDILYTQGLANTKSKLLNSKLSPKILPNKLGDSSGVFGAAMLNYTKHKK